MSNICQFCKVKLTAQDHFQSIPLIVACSECAEQHRDRGMPLTCATIAMKEFSLLKVDLQGLKCLYMRNPHGRSFAPMKCYVRAELEVMSQRRAAANRARDDERSHKLQGERQIRVEHLLSHHKVDPQTVTDLGAQYCIFGDYLQAEGKPFKGVNELKARFKLFHGLAAEICPRDPVAAIYYIEANQAKIKERKGKKRLKAEDVKDEFEHNADLLAAVFEKASQTIARFVGPADKKKLEEDGSLMRLTEEFRSDTDRKLLMNELQRRGISQDEVVKDPAFKRRLAMYAEYEQDPEFTAEKISKFKRTRKHKAARKAELQTALTRLSMPMAEAGKCKSYVDGKQDIDLDELVGMVALQAHVRSEGGAIATAELYPKFQVAFREAYFNDVLGLEGSIAKAKGSVKISRKYRRFV